MRETWSTAEVKAIVKNYFDMLRSELADVPYSKSAHRQALVRTLNDRSSSSIEWKHQNISAVLIEMGIPYIVGYKPAVHFQHSLSDAVSEFLTAHADFQTLFKQDAEVVPDTPSVSDFLAAIDAPPKAAAAPESAVQEKRDVYNPADVNWLEREARNQSLGKIGEEFVIGYERARLIQAGREALADRIEHVALTQGPQAGYDIRSFETDGRDRFIEAKTTKYGKSTPFFISPNELRFSEDNSQRYFLYRVFQFRRTPRLFALSGDVKQHCALKPSQYWARPR